MENNHQPSIEIKWDVSNRSKTTNNPIKMIIPHNPILPLF